MHYVYVLKSQRNGKRYVGMTSKHPLERMREHNAGSSTWSSHNSPFELVYTEAFTDRAEARKRELFLKSGVGREQLETILSSNSVKGE